MLGCRHRSFGPDVFTERPQSPGDRSYYRQNGRYVIYLCNLVFGIGAEELGTEPLPPTTRAFRWPLRFLLVRGRVGWGRYRRALSGTERVRLPVKIPHRTNVPLTAGSLRTPSRAHCSSHSTLRAGCQAFAGDRPHGVLDSVFFAEQHSKNRSLSLRPVVSNRCACRIDVPAQAGLPDPWAT